MHWRRRRSRSAYEFRRSGRWTPAPSPWTSESRWRSFRIASRSSRSSLSRQHPLPEVRVMGVQRCRSLCRRGGIHRDGAPTQQARERTQSCGFTSRWTRSDSHHGHLRGAPRLSDTPVFGSKGRRCFDAHCEGKANMTPSIHPFDTSTLYTLFATGFCNLSPGFARPEIDATHSLQHGDPLSCKAGRCVCFPREPVRALCGLPSNDRTRV